MAQLIEHLDPERVAENLRRVREEIAMAAARGGRDPDAVAVLAAIKYLSASTLPALAAAGVTLVGENRAQELERKAAAHGPLFEWHFIGQLQSRRVRQIVPQVTLIHSVASASALGELAKHAGAAQPGLEILIEVNVAGEDGKAGVAPAELDRHIELSPFPVAGLMTMPPATDRAQDSRRWFALLREQAQRRGLRELSMGTSQDYVVAVEEGATIVRIGTTLYR